MDNLNVYTNNQVNNQSGNRPGFSPKIIFIILGVVILIEVVFAVKALTAPFPTPSSPPQSAVAKQPSDARISLTSTRLNYAVGEIIKVVVAVNTGGRLIDGVDLIVRFNPQVLEIAPGGLSKGKIFSEYPLLSQDDKTGLISISGVSGVKESFTGQGEFAILTLKAKLPGRTTLAIDFQKGTTTTSNLVESATSKNILGNVDNLELNIQ